MRQVRWRKLSENDKTVKTSDKKCTINVQKCSKTLIIKYAAVQGSGEKILRKFGFSEA